MPKNVELLDNGNDILYPRTKTEQVIVTSTQNLNVKLDEIDASIESVTNEVTNARTNGNTLKIYDNLKARLDDEHKELGSEIEKTNTQLSLVEEETKINSKRIDWFRSVSEYGELSQAKYYSNGVWYEDDQHTIPTKDMSTVIQACIDDASNKGVNTVHMKKGSYLIENTIKIPYWMNVDFELSTLIPVANGNYTNNYMIMINSNDGNNVSTPYGGSDYCTIENIIFDNKQQIQNIRGIFQGASGTIQRIRSHMMYNTITRANEYLDFTKIHNIECAVPRGNDYQIIIKNVGDALEISRCHMWGWDVPGDTGKNMIFVHNSQGGEIRNVINGRIKLVSCNGFGIYNAHLEEGNIEIENSTVTVQNVFMHKKDYCTPFVIKNCQTVGATGNAKSVKLQQAIIYYFNGRYTKGVDYKDIEISNSGVELNGVYRGIIGKNGDLASSCLYGCSVYNNGNKLTYSYRFPISMVHSYVTPDGMLLGLNSSMKDHNQDDWGLNNIWATNFMDSTLQAGTYFYTVIFYNDVYRQLGFQGRNGQKSVTIGDKGCPLIELDSKYTTCRCVRIYRGTTASTYTHYVDVPVVQGAYLYDTGADVAGYPWIATTSKATHNAGYADVICKGNNIECRGDKPPTNGNWTTGDIVYRKTPEVGQPVGWVYTATGSQWLKMGLYS